MVEQAFAHKIRAAHDALKPLLSIGPNGTALMGFPSQVELWKLHAAFAGLETMVRWIDQGERNAASAAPPAQAVSVGVPESVRYAVERMSIDPTWLKGVTAQEDARCMLIIADFISSLSAAPAAATREGKE